jgi:hypothetical protein
MRNGTRETGENNYGLRLTKSREKCFLSSFESSRTEVKGLRIGCALTFASEVKFEIKAKISFRLEAKKKPDFT